MTRTPRLDRSRLAHLMGFRTSLADIRLRRAFHHSMKDYQLRPVDFTILLLLESNPDISQKRLAQALSMSAPGLAVILDRLEARELMVRGRSATDRRQHRLELTEAGQALAHEVHARSFAMEDEVLGALTPEERTELARLLDKVAAG